MHNPTWSRAGAVAALAAAVFFGLQAARGGSAGAAPPAPATVAVVDVTQITGALTEAKDLSAAQAQRFDGYRKQVEQAETDAKAAFADAEEAKKLNDPSMNAKIAKAIEAKAQLQARANALQEVKEIEAGTTKQALYDKVIAAVNAVADEQGLDLVLLDDRPLRAPDGSRQDGVLGAITARKILFARKRLDITQDVITRMNNDYAAGKKN